MFRGAVFFLTRCSYIIYREWSINLHIHKQRKINLIKPKPKVEIVTVYKMKRKYIENSLKAMRKAHTLQDRKRKSINVIEKTNNT